MILNTCSSARAGRKAAGGQAVLAGWASGTAPHHLPQHPVPRPPPFRLPHLVLLNRDALVLLARPAAGVVLDRAPHHHLAPRGVQPHAVRVGGWVWGQRECAGGRAQVRMGSWPEAAKSQSRPGQNSQIVWCRFCEPECWGAWHANAPPPQQSRLLHRLCQVAQAALVVLFGAPAEVHPRAGHPRAQQPDQRRHILALQRREQGAGGARRRESVIRGVARGGVSSPAALPTLPAQPGTLRAQPSCGFVQAVAGPARHSRWARL